jgi:G3E family GTPase
MVKTIGVSTVQHAMQRSKPQTEAILLSGFLGSGKTTLLNHVLSFQKQLSDTVVIMNEFGDISIDGLLIDQDVTMVELVNGCICCKLQLDLRKQIETLVNRRNPRWLIIEATGLADSGAIIDILADFAEKAVLRSYRLIAVIDAEIWPMRHILGTIFDQQLVHADLILLNKIDMLDPEMTQTCLMEVMSSYPRAEIEPTAYCRIDMERLQWVNAKTSRAGTVLRGVEHIHDSTVGWASLSFIEERPLDEEKFNQFIREHRQEIFRLKGVVQFRDRVSVLNHVHGASEWREGPADGKTRLVIIGRLTDLMEIDHDLQSCIVG